MFHVPLRYSAWIGDDEDPLIDRLSQRTSAMNNLTLDTVELFQVTPNITVFENEI
jgi:hypothetical protein